jgi:sulfane dehydrogenase subunit SoxC
MDTTKQQGGPATAHGARSPAETSARLVDPLGDPRSTHSLTPLQDLHGIITPSGLHFERHHAGVPQIKPEAHRLLLHGLVNDAKIFTVEDIKRFPATTKNYFIECSGNGYREWNGPIGKSVQETHGLTSCSEWTGVPLKHLLGEAHIAPGAAWVIAEGADGAAMTRSVPLDKCLDDVLVAYAQNGEMLRPEQGYPLRLLVPGWEGNISVKWLRRLKVVDRPYQTREETSKYTDLMPDGSAKQFTFVMHAKSVITYPSGKHKLPGPGFYEIRGLAWSGRGRITRVEVSTDDGASWQECRLQGPVLDKCHTRFSCDWRWQGKATIIQSRCTDESGYRQSTRTELQAAQGKLPSYHYNAIQRWRIDASGEASNV